MWFFFFNHIFYFHRDVPEVFIVTNNIHIYILLTSLTKNLTG